MARGINKTILVDEYAKGDSIPVVAAKHGVSQSTVRCAALAAGVLRTREEGIRLAAAQGRLGSGLRGKARKFSADHMEAMRKSAMARAERTALGESIKPSGYVEITRGDHKGRAKHRVVAEQMLGRPLKDDEVVHHRDRDRSNNDPANLEVMTRAEHTSLHRREKH